MTRTYKHLSPEERGMIMGMKHSGNGLAAIGRALGRAPSTIFRELERNPPVVRTQNKLGRKLIERPVYDAASASKRAHKKRFMKRRKCKLEPGGALWKSVSFLIQNAWSPEQISLRFKQSFPKDSNLQVSHETIYTAIYAMPVGGLRKDLVDALRRHHHVRRKRDRKAGATGPGRGVMRDMVSIHVRPPEASDRLLPGHWEGDLIIGANGASRVGTLVCRKTMFVMLVKIDGATALDTLRGFEGAFSPLDPSLRKSLTYDQGKEMALHKQLAESTGLKIYFADPSSPWQRGSNENTNGLIRQYLPKGIDLSVYSQRDLDRIAWSLNTRPRKTLNAQTPYEVLIKDCTDGKVGDHPIDALDA